MNPQDIVASLKQVKYDLSVIQTRVDEAMRAAAAMPQPPAERFECPVCHTGYRAKWLVDEHHYRAHDGPVPPHYVTAERLAELPDVSSHDTTAAEAATRESTE